MSGNCFVWKQDGSRFHGMFYKNKKDGTGNEKLPDGRLIEGIWKNGTLIDRWQDEAMLM